jgi:hypothetical protein
MDPEEYENIFGYLSDKKYQWYKRIRKKKNKKDVI